MSFKSIGGWDNKTHHTFQKNLLGALITK